LWIRCRDGETAKRIDGEAGKEKKSRSKRRCEKQDILKGKDPLENFETAKKTASALKKEESRVPKTILIEVLFLAITDFLKYDIFPFGLGMTNLAIIVTAKK
jgi:hypothetical protein